MLKKALSPLELQSKLLKRDARSLDYLSLAAWGSRRVKCTLLGASLVSLVFAGLCCSPIHGNYCVWPRSFG